MAKQKIYYFVLCGINPAENKKKLIFKTVSTVYHSSANSKTNH